MAVSIPNVSEVAASVVSKLMKMGFSQPEAYAVRDSIIRTQKTLTNLGQITGRTENIATTAQQLDSTGKLKTADAIAADGATFGRTLVTALTANQVDLSKAGVIGPLGSAKINQNVMFNYSNNATVDSIDNGTNATIRVYGPGGVGTTWHQFIGSAIGPENPAFSGTAAYNTSFLVVYNGISYVITQSGTATLPDGIIWAASIKTVSAGGGGGTSGGGGSSGGGGGRQQNLLP